MSKPRKLSYYQVLHVVRKTKKYGSVTLRAIESVPTEDVNWNWFVARNGNIYLPPRQRGDKFVVMYTEVKEKIL